MIRHLALGLVISLSACAGSGDASESSPVISQNDVSFREVLDEYQALNTRLDRVAAPLLKNNAGLCPKTSRDIGMTVHTRSDYPPELQRVAARLIGVTEGLSVRTVRAGSEADKAGILPGDEIVKIGEQSLTPSPDIQNEFGAISKTEYAADSVGIELSRNGKTIKAQVTPETICGYPVIVFFSEHINGHTDGEEVWITSELLRQVPEDVNLALIVSHEMAHAIAGHMAMVPSKDLELEADRMALTMMDQAGYNIDEAISYWKNAPHPYQNFESSSTTHPTIEERYQNFLYAKQRIQP